MSLLRLVLPPFVLLAACATQPGPHESFVRGCEAGDLESCVAVASYYYDHGEKDRARPMLADACRRGRCDFFHGYYGMDRPVEDRVREVCGDDASCRQSRTALFTSWDAAATRDRDYDVFEDEARARCDRATAEVAAVQEPDCNLRSYYTSFAKFQSACERKETRVADIYTKAHHDLQQLPHYRDQSEILFDDGRLHPLPDFFTTYTESKCRPPATRSPEQGAPPSPTTAELVKTRRAACKAEDRSVSERDCLRLELYDRTKLDPRAPLSPEETAQLDARYQELYGARDQERARLARERAKADDEQGRKLAMCIADATAKVQAWQTRLDGSKTRHQKLALGGTHVDPQDPASPLVTVEKQWGFVERKETIVLDQYNRVVMVLPDEAFYRAIRVDPSPSALQHMYDARCNAEIPPLR